MNNDYLMHHGIKGQKWGVRRYQNEDGSLTQEGKERYYNSNGDLTEEGEEAVKYYDKVVKQNKKNIYNLLKKYDSKDNKFFDEDGAPYDDYENYINNLEQYAKKNGHKKIDQKDVELYKNIFDQHFRDSNTWLYLNTDHNKKNERKRNIAKATVGAALGIIGAFAIGGAVKNKLGKQ